MVTIFTRQSESDPYEEVGPDNPLTVALAAPLGSGLINRSGSIATGGTAQQAAAPNARRRYLLIQNKSTAGESFWISLDATAVADSPSIEVMPGAGFVWEDTFIPDGAISVIAATTGTKYTVKEG